MLKLKIALVAGIATMASANGAKANCWSVKEQFIQQGQALVSDICTGEGKIAVDDGIVKERMTAWANKPKEDMRLACSQSCRSGQSAADCAQAFVSQILRTVPSVLRKDGYAGCRGMAR